MNEDATYRVLVLLGSIPLLGQERGNIEAIRALSETGADALFVTHDGYGHEVIEPYLDLLGQRWTRARFTNLWSFRMSPVGLIAQIRDFVQGNIDIVRAARQYGPTHIHVGNERFLLNLLPAVWWLRKPIVFRLGDEPRQHKWPYRLIWRRLLIPSTSVFVCVSDFVRRSLIKAGADPESVRVIYSHPSQRPEAGDTVVESARVGVRTVLYVGQLTKDKGVDLLVQAAITLCEIRQDVRFVLAGDYTWKNPFAHRLIQEVKSRGLEDRIEFTGYVHDIPARLRSADIHACPSVWEEPLSNTLVEAKAAGTPSVIFPSGGLPELVEHGVDGYITTSKSTECLLQGIAFFLDRSDAELENASNAARQSLSTLGITEAEFVAAWAEVYDSVATTMQSSHDAGTEPSLAQPSMH